MSFLVKYSNTLSLSILLILTSCIGETPKSQDIFNDDGIEDELPSIGPGGDDDVDDEVEEEDNSDTEGVELKFIVDPTGGVSGDDKGRMETKKVTMPKNLNTVLYLTGIKFSALRSKKIYVRFLFGKDYEAVTVPAVVATASEVVPQVNSEMLVINLKSRPFERIRLFYDLYDYSDYTGTTEPTKDPYNQNLYCRGLKLVDDPTFESTTGGSACQNAGDKCLYTYAKVVDNGLLDASSIAQVPTEPQIDVAIGDYATPLAGDTATIINTRTASNLKKCLPDNGQLYYRNNVDATTNGYYQLTYNTADTIANFGDTVLTTGTATTNNYTYNGPYRLIGTGEWEMGTGAALDDAGGRTGLFETTYAASAIIDRGIRSYMFPRAGKMELEKDISYLGNSSSPYTNQQRTLETLSSSGDTKWMDGCNLRVSNYDSSTGEGIQSCNISAKIQVLDINTATNKETLITEASDLKLQLIRSSLINEDEEEVFYQSMKSCSTSRACAYDECCFNERCWPSDMVSQCLEDSKTKGLKKVGASCSSDFACASLCCNNQSSSGTSGTCGWHDLSPADDADKEFCSKNSDETCITSEYCKRELVEKHIIAKKGPDGTGKETCGLYTYHELVHGTCKGTGSLGAIGKCVSPEDDEIPDFDENEADCSNAVEVPTDIEGDFDD